MSNKITKNLLFRPHYTYWPSNVCSKWFLRWKGFRVKSGEDFGSSSSLLMLPVRTFTLAHQVPPKTAPPSDLHLVVTRMTGMIGVGIIQANSLISGNCYNLNNYVQLSTMESLNSNLLNYFTRYVAFTNYRQYVLPKSSTIECITLSSDMLERDNIYVIFGLYPIASLCSEYSGGIPMIVYQYCHVDYRSIHVPFFLMTMPPCTREYIRL